jgi:hypothetical protein
VEVRDVADHPDVHVGTTSAGDASVEVLVSGVDVRLTVRRQAQEEVEVFLGPDEAANLRDLLARALSV